GRGARQLLQLVAGLAPVGLELVGVPREHEPALASGFGGRRGEPAAHPADRGRREDEDEEEEEEALHAAGLTAAAAAGEAAQRKPAAEAERSLLQTCRARSPRHGSAGRSSTLSGSTARQISPAEVRARTMAIVVTSTSFPPN